MVNGYEIRSLKDIIQQTLKSSTCICQCRLLKEDLFVCCLFFRLFMYFHTSYDENLVFDIGYWVLNTF